MEAIINFYTHADIFLLVFVRIIGILVVVPIFSGNNIPEIAKTGLAFTIAIIIMYVNPSMEIIYDASIIGYGFLVIKEVITGLIIGFIIYVLFEIFFFVGQLVSLSSGLSMSNMFDPTVGRQVPVMGKLYHYTACALFLVTNGHHLIFRALIYSYSVIPLGEAKVGANIVAQMIMILTNYFIISIKIAAPIMVTMFILDFALGILARTAPQMNMFVIGFPVKIMIAMIMLSISTILMNTAYSYIYDQIKINTTNVIRGLIR